MTSHDSHRGKDIAAVIRDAIDSGTVVRGVGSGTWLHGGPVENDPAATVVQPPSGVIEYAPGDLVMSVHAGSAYPASSGLINGTRSRSYVRSTA